MDWDKALNYILVFLFILNIILFALNITKKDPHTFEKDSKTSIVKVLQRNNIYLDSDIPEKYEPMEIVYLKKNKTDIISLQKNFFLNTNIKKTQELDSTILSDGKNTLTVKDNTVTFETNKDREITSLEDAENICGDLIEKYFGDNFDYSFDNIIEKDSYYLINYVKECKDTKLFNNYLKLVINKTGEIFLEFSCNDINGISSSKIELCPPDEALYVFMNEITKLYDDRDTHIIGMDLGFFAPDNQKEELTALPHYRIYTDTQPEPFYINAYNKTAYH